MRVADELCENAADARDAGEVQRVHGLTQSLVYSGRRWGCDLRKVSLPQVSSDKTLKIKRVIFLHPFTTARVVFLSKAGDAPIDPVCSGRTET